MNAESLAVEAQWPRETIDRDYNARASVAPPTYEAIIARYRTLSDDARHSCGTHLDVAYDYESGQTLDIYGTRPHELRPVFLFIHGGYWRALSKRDSAFMAPVLESFGIATAVVDYRLAPVVTLAEIVREVRAAAAFLWHEGHRYGIETGRIFAGGSSAGGHLTGALLAGGWHRAFGVPPTLLKGALPVSGLFHLAPIAHSFVNDWMSLTEEDIARLSPALHLPHQGCPISVAYADGEPNGFARQSRTFDRIWRQAGFSSALMTIPERNHFDVVLDLADPRSDLTRALVAQILEN